MIFLSDKFIIYKILGKLKVMYKLFCQEISFWIGINSLLTKSVEHTESICFDLSFLSLKKMNLNGKFESFNNC